jgi:hypothetical protein
MNWNATVTWKHNGMEPMPASDHITLSSIYFMTSEEQRKLLDKGWEPFYFSEPQTFAIARKFGGE